LYLYDDLGAPVDSIEFGLQVPDLSIGRTGADRGWSLTQPSIGAENVAQRTADADGVLINEWFTNGDVVLVDDFIELYNPDVLPVDVSGLYVTDNPANQKTKHEIGPLSFIGAEGYRALTADDRSAAGHVNFQLSAKMEILGLFDAGLGQMDRIYYGPQTEDLSQGRTPDGSDTIEFFTLPTPDVGNVTEGTFDVTSETLVTETDDMHVLVPTGDIGTDWRTDQVFDTAGWHFFQPSLETPPAIAVGFDSGDGNYDDLIGLDLVAEMDDKNGTCYIRIPFTYSGDPSEITDLTLSARYDDGFIAYLNGEEIHRENFAVSGTPAWNSNANDTHSDSLAVNPVSFDVSEHIDELEMGDNLLAIHALNAGVSSSDFLMSFELVADIKIPLDNPFGPLLALHNDLRITELMYNPDGSDSREFIEFQNTGTSELQLGGLRLTDGVDFVFPEMTLAAGEYVVVARDLAAFEAFYGPGINAIGDYDPDALNNAGEDVLLQMPEPYEAALLRFEYDDNWYPSTDGDGLSLVMNDPAGRRSLWDEATGWRAGSVAGGSPGADDPAPELPAGSIIINEVLAHTDEPRGDWIELYNTTGDDIDISGWFLSDDPGTPEKFVVPGDPGTPFAESNTVILAGGYVAFNQTDHFGVDSTHPGKIIGFGLSEHGDEAVVSSCDATGALGIYRAFATFEANANGVTLGRYTTSTGNVDFVALSADTYEAENAYPAVGPIVIEEIMYHPLDGSDENEYVLLKNITGGAVDLFDPANPTNTWKFTDGVVFAFPQGVTVPAGGFVLVTDVAESTYRSTHHVPGHVQVFGPFEDQSALSNAGEPITLGMPGTPETIPDPFVPYIITESVKYDDDPQWPEEPDGGGPALGRLVSGDYGNDPVNWGLSLAPSFDGHDIDASGGLLQPEVTLDFSKPVYAEASDVTVFDASMAPVAASFDLTGSGTETLVITFNAPLSYGGPYTISFGAAGIGDLTGRAPLGGPVEVTYMAAIAGDVNVDQSVDLADLTIMGHPGHWGQSGMTWLEGDLDGDGIVNGLDLAVLSAAYGNRFSVSTGTVVSQPLTPPTHDPSIPFGPQLPTVVDSTSTRQASGQSVLDDPYAADLDSPPDESKAASPDPRLQAVDAAALALMSESDSDDSPLQTAKTRLAPPLLDLLAEEQIGPKRR